MNELSTTGAREILVRSERLEAAKKLNHMTETSQVMLGMALVRIKEFEDFKPEYETFDQWYKVELKRSKGDISKLLKVGQFMLDGGFPQDTDVPYTVLHTAILSLPDKSPEYVLSTAQTNTIAEILENRRDDAFGSDHKHTLGSETYKRCEECGKFERV